MVKFKRSGANPPGPANGELMPRTFPSLLRPDNFELTAEMERVIEAVRDGKHLFLTGKAGTGKSTLLDYLRDEVFSKRSIYLGYTGVSALNIDGRTIHSFFRFGTDVTREQVSEQHWRPGSLGAISRLETMVIDEVSMVRADLLDCIEITLRRFGPQKGEPFGGVQVVLIGDPRQLPPIVKNQELRFFREQFGSQFFFDSAGAGELDFEVVELTKNFRQSSKEFYDVLDSIRDGAQTEDQLNLLNSRVKSTIGDADKRECIRLTTKNNRAREINAEELALLKGQAIESVAIVRGVMRESDYPTDEVLRMKVGARIMMVHNDSAGRWVNGTLGVITKVEPDADSFFPRVEVRFDGEDESIPVNSCVWSVLEPKYKGGDLEYEQIASFEQLPFRLAWAITMHKSQGKTFDRVIIDLSSDPFVAGQLYVALSRCRSLEGILLTHPVLPAHVMVNDVVTNFMNDIGIGSK